MASSPSVEPLLKPFALALGEYLGEGPEVSGEAVEFWAVDRDCPESKVVDIREGLEAGGSSRRRRGVKAAELRSGWT